VLPVPPHREWEFWYDLSPRVKGECWPWKHAKSAQGYGRVRINGKLECAHRVAFSLAKGDELVHGAKCIVLHSCDNPACCNPEHLRLGTHRENVREMYARGREPEHMKPQAGSRRSLSPSSAGGVRR
jgi:hypothetical protein